MSGRVSWIGCSVLGIPSEMHIDAWSSNIS